MSFRESFQNSFGNASSPLAQAEGRNRVASAKQSDGDSRPNIANPAHQRSPSLVVHRPNQAL